MKKKITYTDEPMKTGKIVKDFLPGPEGLSFRKERVLTLRLDEPTIAELKEVADNKGMGMSTLVRMWVKERLASNASMQNYKENRDMLRSADIDGVHGGGSSNLNTSDQGASV